jgi:hypothetical protein
MRIFFLVLALAMGANATAEARCADDFKEIQGRVDRQMAQQPQPPQAIAASKQVKKANEEMARMDEIDCYNAVSRIRRTLATPAPPVEAKKDEGAAKHR